MIADNSTFVCTEILSFFKFIFQLSGRHAKCSERSTSGLETAHGSWIRMQRSKPRALFNGESELRQFSKENWKRRTALAKTESRTRTRFPFWWWLCYLYITLCIPILFVYVLITQQTCSLSSVDEHKFVDPLSLCEWRSPPQCPPHHPLPRLVQSQ